MTRRCLLSVCLTIAAAIGLCAAILWATDREQKTLNMQCRPSSPEQMPAGNYVLFWGNSLAFDHGWSLDGYQAVNCAIQGLTAARAVPMTERLPKMDFSAIVLVFGTVELVREIEDVAQFASAMDQIRQTLGKVHRQTKIVILGVPEGGPDVWLYGGNDQLYEINEVLRGQDDAVFLNTTNALSELPQNEQTYDRVHLSPASYRLLEQALLGVIGAD